MKIRILAVVLLLRGLAAWADPVADGKITAGEYANSKSVVNGTGTLYWAWDAKGGVTLALSVKNTGWLSVGLGTKTMTGSQMYMGFVDAKGKPVFSEQTGAEHIHSPTGTKNADKFAVTLTAGVEVIEFHLPAGKIPTKGKNVPFIVAWSSRADLVSPHGDNYDIGVFPIP